VANREKNLQDTEIRLEDVPYRERSPSIEQLLVDMDKGNGERSPSAGQFFGTDMAGVMGSADISTSLSISMMGSTPHPLCSHPFQSSLMKGSTPYHFCPHFLSKHLQ
jgi:hypothetical protein